MENLRNVKWRTAIVGACTAVLLVGCNSRLVTEPLNSTALAAPSSGAEYQLLRQDFLIQAEWTLTRCEATRTSDSNVSYAFSTNFTAVLRPEKRADPKHFYRISVEELAKGSKDVALDIEFYDSSELGGRVIKTLNATVEDKTTEIIKGGIGIASTVARLVVGIPIVEIPTPPPTPLCKDSVVNALAKVATIRGEIAALGRENHIIDKQLAQLEGISQTDEAGVRVIQQQIRALLKKKQDNMAIVKANSNKLRKSVSLLSLSTTRRLDPEWTDTDFTNSMLVDVIAQANAKWLRPNPSQGLNFADEKFAKELTAQLRLRFVGAEPVRVAIPSGPIDGLLLRQPLDADVFVCRYKCKPEILDAYLMAARANALRLDVEKDVLKRLEQESKLSYRGRFSVPQAGHPVVIPLHNGAFQNNGIELARDSEGRIQKFGYKTNAAIAAAVAASADSAKQIEGLSGTLSNADLLRKQQELDRLTVEEGLLLKRQSIDKLKLELQEN